MTPHNSRLLDLYTDYLLVSFGATTATGLARLLPEISHDQVTRFLAHKELTDKDLWKIVKAHVRRVQSPDAVLIIDDTVEEKPYTDESELVCWHFNHSENRMVKGINLLSAVYLSQDMSLPVAFELIKKTELVTDKKTGKDKWQSKRTKNEYARDMVASVVHKQIPFRYVLADIWFSSSENMVFIKLKAKKDFIMPLKSNRRVAVSEADKKRGQWTSQLYGRQACTVLDSSCGSPQVDRGG
jgi:SRSO17 transposase